MKQNLLTFLLIFLVLGYASGVVMVYVHEQVHIAIYESYGVRSEMKINFLTLSGSTSADKIESQEKCKDNCRLAHNINEVVGYHLNGIVFILICLFVLSLITKKEREDGNA